MWQQQTVGDQYNRTFRYSSGTLIGNWVEDKIALDILGSRKERIEKEPPAKTYYQKTHNKQSSLLNQNDPSQKAQLPAVPSSLFFGHGPTLESFKETNFRSTYDLQFNQKKRTNEIIHPMYRPEPLRVKQDATSSQFQEEKKESQDRKPRSYSEFTKKFDASQNKLNLR